MNTEALVRCSFCGAAFNSLEGLRAHKQEMMRAEQGHIHCFYCGRDVHEYESLKLHVQEVIGALPRCSHPFASPLTACRCTRRNRTCNARAAWAPLPALAP